MPAIFNILIGPSFVFLACSLVVMALNELVLCKLDQSADADCRSFGIEATDLVSWQTQRSRLLEDGCYVPRCTTPEAQALLFCLHQRTPRLRRKVARVLRR